MVVDAFTISSNNYLGMARVLAESYLEHHPGARVFVCLVDRLDERVPYEDLPFEIILAEDLGIPEFPNFAFRYDILELNTAVKPFVFKYLRDTIGLDRAFYFDPDILVHDRLGGLEEALAGHQAVLTPHLTEPLDNIRRPPERIIGMCGVYNLGFVGLQLNDGTRGFLDWWSDRLHRYCVVDLTDGLFVDQSWMAFAPAYLDSVAIVRDPILNIAYWNLPHRHPEQVGDHWEVDGRRVGFFHFSGIDVDDLDIISRHQNRIDLWSRPELRPLFEGYRDLVDRSGQQEFRGIPYHYGHFSGTEIAIPWVARVALQGTDPRAMRWPDPFDVRTDDSFLAWLTEPLELEGHFVNRTLLSIWQERSDIRQVFPDLVEEDLPRFLEWLFAIGGREEALHPAFMEALRIAPPPVEPDPLDEELEKVSRIDLSNPGELNAWWLNEPVADGAGPVLTRLSMAIRRAFPDVEARYADPLGRDRQQFAYWFALEGRGSFGLHADLVAPVRRSLPLISRMILRLKVLVKPSSGGVRRVVLPESEEASPPPPSLASSSAPGPAIRVVEEAGRPIRTSPPVGVNLLGFFEGKEGERGLAPEIQAALSASGLPHAAVNLDREVSDQMTSSRFRLEEGLPFPVTVLAVSSDLWVSLLWRLPLSNWLGTRVIGYCTEIRDSLATTDAKWVKEIWTPTEDMARMLEGELPVPVRIVPPTITQPEDTGVQTQWFDRSRFWFLAVGGVYGEEDEESVSAAIESIRQLEREGKNQIGLCLAVDPRQSFLERQLRHLPIRVVAEPLNSANLDRLLSACHGLLDMHSNPRIGPIHVKAAMRGMPVVAAWSEMDRVVRGSFDSDLSASSELEGSSGSIGPVVAAMRAVVAGGDSANERITKLSEEMQDAMKPIPSGVLWAAEVRRLMNDVGVEDTAQGGATKGPHDGDADLQDTPESSSEIHL